MKLRIISDLHLEFFKGGYPDWLDDENDVLVLAGDIHVGPRKLQDVLHRVADVSRHVIYVFGNHEYYGYNLSSYDNISVPSNVHILNPGSVVIDGIKFSGATLWTDFRGNPTAAAIAAKGITDYRVIRNFNTNITERLYEEQSKFLVQENPDVAITHFLPSPCCISSRWQQQAILDPTVDMLNYYFAGSELKLNGKLYIFGHTHDRIDLNYNGCRYIANPYGYHNREQTPEFDPSLTISLN